MGVLANTAAQLVNALGLIYLLAVLLRFLLQIARVDFYNPVSQAVFKITNPTVKIIRGFIPGVRGIDFSTLVLAFLIEVVLLCTLSMIYGYSLASLGVVRIIAWSFAGVLLFIVNIYFFAIFASIIMSFVMIFSGNTNPHPLLSIVWQLTEPVMAPFRKIVPPLGGMDFSPIFVFIAIYFIESVVEGAFGIDALASTLIVGVF